MTLPLEDKAIIRRHARKRCKERLGFKLTTKIEKQITKAVESGRYRLIDKEIDGRMKIDVDMAGRIMCLVYSTKLKMIITVLERSIQAGL